MFSNPPRNECTCLRRYFELKAQSRSATADAALFAAAAEPLSPGTLSCIPAPRVCTPREQNWQSLRYGGQYRGEWARLCGNTSKSHRHTDARCERQHGQGQFRNLQSDIFYDGGWKEGQSADASQQKQQHRTHRSHA